MKRFFQKFWDVVKNFFQKLWEDIKTPFKFINKTYSNSLATRYIFYFSIILIVFILVQRYIFNFTEWADWTGFSNTQENDGKTLWDWLELLIIPFVLAIGAFFLNKSERNNDREIAERRFKNEQEIETDRQHEEILQSYFNRMNDLILEKDKNLLESEPEDKIRIVARTLTIATIFSLDSRRKDLLFRFLYETQLIGNSNPVINFSFMNFTGIDLSGLILSKLNFSNSYFFKANLSFTNLSETHLAGTYLAGVDLRGADLARAYLERANLAGANLAGANLPGAYLAEAHLTRAILAGANLTDTYLIGVDLREANLESAGLAGAKLTEAKLAGANLDKTYLIKTEITLEQLSEVKSLKGATLPGGLVFESDDPKDILKPPYSSAK